MQILRRKTVGSTNAEALVLADRDCLEWTVLVADEQTSGRGRSGNYWHSPSGGLWLSVVLRPNLTAENLALIQFFAANSARRVLKRSTGKRIGVKWPNDLILDSLKLGGILVEARLVSSKIAYAVVGIGLNLNIESSSLPKNATSTFEATGHLLDQESLMVALLEELHSSYSDLYEKDKILPEWWQHCVHRMKQVTVVRHREQISGVSTGLGHCGELLIKTSSGETLELTEGTILRS